MTADDVIKVASTFSTWVASHVVAIGAAVTAILPVLVILGVIHLTSEELAGCQLGIAGVVAAITGKGTVDKPRVGERITEGIAKELPRAVEKEMIRQGTGASLASSRGDNR